MNTPPLDQPARFVLTAAAALPVEYWETLSASELELSEFEAERVAALWLWLCGVNPSSADAGRVRREVLSDGALVVALSLPALELFRWLRGACWADFDSTERTGSEAWAWGALQRIWGACESLGSLASQCSVGAPG